MIESNTTETNGVTDNVRVQVFHDLHERADWDELSEQEKVALAREADPDECHTSHNVTLVGFHNYLVDEIDPSQTVDLSASHLAVGTSGTTPTVSDTGLGTEVYRTATSDDSDNGTEFFTSTFLDTSEANGNTLKEVGLVTASSGGTFVNHALINDIVKDDQTTALIDVTIGFNDA